MKRALTQKINPIPACTADCSMVGSFRPIPPEVNRRARTSAAMIGLAISMGASSSVLLPRQGDSAVATEPKANWAVSTVTNAMTETIGSQEVKSVTGQALEPQPLAHQIQELPANASSSLNHNTESQSVTIEQPEVVSETPDSELATASSVDQLLKVKQAVALNRLKESSNRLRNSLAEESSNRLRNSLAEWKSEESSIKSSVPVNEPAVPTVVSRQLQPIIESSPAVEPVSPQWQAKVATVKPTEAEKPEAKADLGQQLKVEEPTVSAVYQVRPGDTIEAIARKYDVSVVTLAKANQLDNPNRIRVAQQLKVPQNTVSALPISTQQLETNYSEFQPVSPKLAPETLSSYAAPNLPVVSALLPQPSSENAPADVTAAAFPLTQQGTDDVPGWDVSANEPVETISAPATGNKFLSVSKPTDVTNKDNSSAETQNNQFVLAENITNQEADNRTKQYSNPYVERLRAEILQLRQHGRQQAGANPPAHNPAWNGRTATPPATNTNNSAAQLRGTNNYPVNPDFRPNQYNQALQAEIQRRAQEAPANLPRTSYQLPPTQSTRRQEFATAPLGVDPYQPYNQNLPGRTVSPDLPPIQSPYNNYPGYNQEMNGYSWPARGTFTSGYGWRWGRMHRGIDIAAPTGTPIFSSAPGVVVYARWNSGGYGNLVQIRHPDGSLTRYAHNSRIFVQEGQIVEQGQHIAAMGSTGRSTGPHLHFEIHPEGRGAVNPMAFLPRSSR